MKCPKCESEMKQTFTVTLIANDEKEEGTEYTCTECGHQEYGLTRIIK